MSKFLIRTFFGGFRSLYTLSQRYDCYPPHRQAPAPTAPPGRCRADTTAVPQWEIISSRRVSEKTGMHVIATEERDYVSGRLLSEIWEITADEWRAKRQGLRNILSAKE